MLHVLVLGLQFVDNVLVAAAVEIGNTLAQLAIGLRVVEKRQRVFHRDVLLLGKLGETRAYFICSRVLSASIPNLLCGIEHV